MERGPTKKILKPRLKLAKIPVRRRGPTIDVVKSISTSNYDTKLNLDVYKLEKDAGTLYADPKQTPIMK